MMLKPLIQKSAATYEDLADDHQSDHKSDGLGIPTFPVSFSSKEVLAIITCTSSLAVAFVVVFHPTVAVYLGQNEQYIVVGLCLTLMGWCAQLSLRRIFLVTSTSSQASTIQSIDAILRSDPLTRQADWRVCSFLVVMLTLGPALSAAYKSLGGGQSHYLQTDMIGQFGVNSPIGKYNIGYGLSQLVNATLPWFQDPGFPNRVYGYSMHVATENMSAMLDSPTVDYLHSLQSSLKPTQSKIVTATVPAIVCELNAQLDHSVEYFQSLWNQPMNGTTTPKHASTWTQLPRYQIGMLMPVESDNTNIIIADWDEHLNETFGSHLMQYTLSRQNYTGSWRVSQTAVELISAIPSHKRIEDHCLLRSIDLDLTELYMEVFAEYDWRPHIDQTGREFYQEHIKSDATFLASMVWSRITSLHVVNDEIKLTTNPQCDPEGLPELPYQVDVIIETVAVTIKSGWWIVLVLALWPALLITSLVVRVMVWPLSPIGEGFGLISLLASAEKGSLAILEGAGLSGKLDRPVFLGICVCKRKDNLDVTATGNITSFLKIEQVESDTLSRKTKYS